MPPHTKRQQQVSKLSRKKGCFTSQEEQRTAATIDIQEAFDGWEEAGEWREAADIQETLGEWREEEL